MRAKEVLGHPIKTLRTAPFGFAVAGLQIPAVIGDISEVSQNALLGSAALSVQALGIAAGCLLVRRQFKLRDRLEASFEAHGFDERAVAKTVREWCARQTTLVAAEEFGFREQCEDYYATRRDAMQLPNIPHL